MIFLKNFDLFNKLNEVVATTSTKMYDLIHYFEMPFEDKIKLLPAFFHRNYPTIFDDWCLNNIGDFEEVDEDYILPDGIYNLSQYPEAYEKYCNFLYDISYAAIHGNDNPHNLNLAILPPFLTFSYEGDVNNEWLCHFCSEFETVKNIINDKHFLGIDDIDHITITAVNDNEKIPNGYCFAYDIDDTYYNFAIGIKYGTNGVIFKSSGVKLFHSGDDEMQVIFIGNTAKNMVGFYRDEKTNVFYTLDKKISDVDFNEFKEKVINSFSINESVKTYHASIHTFDDFITTKTDIFNRVENINESVDTKTNRKFKNALLNLATLDLEDDQVRYPRTDGKKLTHLLGGNEYDLYILDRTELPLSGAFEIIICDNDDNIIGFIRGTKNRKTISFNLIHIKEEYRRNGIGTAIYEKFLDNGYIIMSDDEITDATYSMYDRLLLYGYKPIVYRDGRVGLKK